jgi:long-chain fatty acid transport protein
MVFRNRLRTLFVTLGSGIFSLVATQALAGSFGVHEHSASAQGASYAGAAAGGQLSSMFWNPAIMTQFGGLSFEASASAFIGNAKNTTGGVTFPDFLDDAFIPAMYAAWQLRPDLWVGMSVNAPFGLSVSFPPTWPGRNYAMDTALKTYNATPSLAYRVNEWLSIGVGLQVEYATAELRSGLPLGTSLLLEGNGWGIGATAGLTITPAPGTLIGIGWRSAINQKIEGTLTLPAFLGGTLNDVSTTLKLPDIVSAGIRQRVSPQVTLLGTVEWTNWSRIDTSTVVRSGGAPTGVTFPFQYRDGWLFSGGVEYAWLPTTTLRAGIGYEISPLTDAVRTPRVPDANRTWISAGLTYMLTPNLKVDLAYSHLFLDTARVAIGPGNPWFNPVLGPYAGTARANIDIISVGVKYQLAPPPPPLLSKG